MAFLPQHCGLRQQPVEGAEQVGDQLHQAHLARHFGRLGDNQVDPVGQALAQRHHRVSRCALQQQTEPLHLLFDLPVAHPLQNSLETCHFSGARDIQ